MKTLLIIALLAASLNAVACSEIYAKIGSGYKFDEEKKFIINGDEFIRRTNSPISARFEIGCSSKKWTYGVSHHSQWGIGWPVNGEGEPYKTEIFIDYKWSWKL